VIGKSISHYRILEKLGGGGMGVVYKAEDTKLHRIVALKFLPPELTRDEEAKQRFIQEAQSASSLDHINICVVHEIDQTEDGQLFICMNYYEGETLKNKIEKGRLGKDNAIDITIQVVQGLLKAHEKGIVHRDIKPANIFITNDGLVKILDFGLAKLSGQVLMTKVGSTLGTIAYMSPEQARGEEVDQRTDIWSLGVVLYEMITGKLPFKGEYEQAIIYGILNEDPEPINEIRSGLTYDIENISKKCLQKNKEERYQYINELLKDLKNLRIGSISNASIKNKKHISLLWSFVSVSVLSIIIVLGYFLYKNSVPSVHNESNNSAATDWKNSIAVLPFRDFSSKTDQEYFCNGITDAIIGRLAKIPELKVIATTSVMRYRNTEKDIKEIGRELNVANILEGTIQKEKNRIRLSAQLISTDNGFHLWSETYDREWKQVFEIQDNVSKAIAEALKVKLTTKASETSRLAQPQNLEAYEYQLRGMNQVNNYIIYLRKEDFNSALTMFQKAIEIEPGYAAPYSGLAWAYQHKIEVTGDLSCAPLVIKYSELAYQKNPNSAEANAAMGWVYHTKRDDDNACNLLRRAIELNPNSMPINHVVGLFLSSIGLCYQAIKFLQKAIELDPYYLYALTLQAGRWRDIGDFAKAEIIYKKVFKLISNNTYYLSVYAYLQIMMGKYSQAEAVLNSARKFTVSDSLHILFCRNLLFAIRGDKDKVLIHTNKSVYLAGEASSDELVYSILGMKDKAINCIKKNIQDGHEHLYLQLINNPLYKNLHSDPRFQEIVDKAKKIYDERLRKYGNL
jgi:eukaryotic-like serine/threonine-protein kinase